MSWVARLQKRVWFWPLIVYLVAQVFFLINIQFPASTNFDEFHYVPSAKQFLAMQENQNWEHPPLGKELMAAGIALWGDRPIGWRFMSTVFGALTLSGMYVWALVLFGSVELALWVAGVSLCNQILYVQARIGMLDTFMFCFLVWGLAAFSKTWDSKLKPEQSQKVLLFSGAMFGLATACKWFGVIAWAACIGLFLTVRLFQNWRMKFEGARSQDWYRPDLWSNLRWSDAVAGFVTLPLVLYFATFVPLMFTHGSHLAISELLLTQKKMWEGQLRVVTNHPYMSRWTDWPLMTRPIWYAFDKDGAHGEFVRGVLCLGNPWIMITGLFGMIYCGWKWIRERDRSMMIIFGAYLIFYGSWAVIPRKISFYYYYYPAAMSLSLALAAAFKDLPRWVRTVYLAISLAFFIYFFPIIAALRIPADSFRNWMWVSSWI